MAYLEHNHPNLEDSNDMVKNFEFKLDESIEHIAHWLPTQGPIKDFIHHNTLHAVQHLPFHEGVAVAAKMYGARSYLPLEDYQRIYRQGRIKKHAIDWAIEHSGCVEQEHETSIAAIPATNGTLLLKNGALRPKTTLNLKVWHEALEWSLHSELLLALKPKITSTTTAPAMKPIPEAQALFCIDDRECSLRRYLEVINPSIETSGAAGFSGIDFLYQGLDYAYPVPQCPDINVPKHLIKNVFRPGSKLPDIRSLIKEPLDNDWVRFVACHPSTRTVPVFD